MVLRIGSNISSLQAQRRLAENTDRLSGTFEHLSSGRRITRASDDAAGLAIAEKLNTDSRIYTQAVRNVNDGLSYLHIADGALGELAHITTRQRELAEQAANGVYSTAQRKAITAEANALVKEYNRIVQSTEFNGRKVLDVERLGGDLRIQAGYGVSGSVAVAVGDMLARAVGTGEFDDAVVYATERTSSNAVATADLNGDGALDIITAGRDGVTECGTSSVLFNDGHGNFSSAVSYVMEAQESLDVAVIDVDGDGALDLVTAGYGAGGSSVTVRKNDGAGNFGAASSYATGETWSNALFLADINGDGMADLMSAGQHTDSTGSATIRLNDGHGNFGSAVSYLTEGHESRDLFVADVNGDGASDLITAGYEQNGGSHGRATVRLNDGQGNFGPAVSYTTEAILSQSLSVKDINGDGAMDLVTVGSNGASAQASVRLNDGLGSFGSLTSYSVENGVSLTGTQVADMNGDGAPDLLLTGWAGTSGYTAIRLNDGQGTFGRPLSYSAEDWYTADLAVGDINGDAVPDLLAAGSSSGGKVAIQTAVVRDVSTIASLDLFSQGAARQALTALQNQQERITSERGVLGSFESRLSVALKTLHVSRENADAAASRLTDADMARESASLVKDQILQQAGAAVLAQAGQQPALALKLLAQ